MEAFIIMINLVGIVAVWSLYIYKEKNDGTIHGDSRTVEERS